MNNYWTTDPGCTTPIFPQTMIRDGFRQIWQAWHSDNQDVVAVGNLAKIKPIIEYFRSKLLNVYKLTQELLLNKNIILWRVRLTFRRKTNQYFKEKQINVLKKKKWHYVAKMVL